MLFVRSVIPRLRAGLATSPTRSDVAWTVGIAVVHASLSLCFGRRTQFLTPCCLKSWPRCIVVGIRAFFLPSLVEELIFRGAILPHPTVDSPQALTFLPLSMASLTSVLIFVVYHLSPWHRPKEVFSDRRFLTLAGILGTACTAVYLPRGCLWMPIAMHYVTVVVWLLFLGGYDKLGKP